MVLFCEFILTNDSVHIGDDRHCSTSLFRISRSPSPPTSFSFIKCTDEAGAKADEAGEYAGDVALYVGDAGEKDGDDISSNWDLHTACTDMGPPYLTNPEGTG